MVENAASSEPLFPGGTVTFLFTDIEGSTKLLDQLRDQYEILLSGHHHIIRNALAKWNGREVDTQGDAFFAVFSKATEAVHAVVDIQRAMNGHQWPEGVQVQVRMGLHTGEPWLVEEGYMGMDVHRAARIGHVGHGGQVLLSETTTSLVLDELPEGVSLLDMGRHLLKDMNRPEHIHQLVIEGLPGDFPPLKSQAALPTESERPARDVGECPYRGLAAFREVDAPFYFGREDFTVNLEKALHQQPMVAVIVGSSGSGKSSALFAGLLPKLRQDMGWKVAVLRPGAQPFYSLAGSLLPYLEDALDETDRLAAAAKLAKRLADGDIYLDKLVERILEKDETAKQLLLVIDQFEELYTLCADEEVQQGFINQLLAVVEAGREMQAAPCVILLTMRADFMGQALAYRPFADTLQEASILMGPMNRAELRSAVEKPAEMQGAAFEAGLVERILDDVGEKPGNLPLLEFTLTQLWEKQNDGWLSHVDYEALGGVEGALASYADQVYEELTPEKQSGTRRVLIQLVRPGEGTEDTRRVATREELGEANWALIRHLADKRLVVTGQDNSGQEIAEVVHEALIYRWGLFREWMENDRSLRAWQERLRGNLRQWQESGEDEGALLSGAPLSVAIQWLGEREEDLSQQEIEYILASKAWQERRQAERERRRRRTIIALIGGLIITIALAAVAYFQRQTSLKQSAILLAGQAESELAAGQHDRAVLLALEALENFPYTAQAERALGQAVTYNRALQKYDGHSSATTSVSWSPDGSRIASSASTDNNIHIWDPVSGELQSVIDLPTGITGNIYDMALNVAWTPDGERLIVMTGDRFTLGSQDFDLHIIDANSGELLSSMEIPNSAAPVSGELGVSFVRYTTGSAIDINPKSGQLATLGGDNTAFIWDDGLTAPEIVLKGHSDAVNSVAWSPDGSELLTSGMDGTARVWDALSGEERLQVDGHEGRINTAIWSPDGNLLATAGDDGTVRLWNAESGDQESLIEPGTESVWSLAWSPDGNRLIIGQYEGQVTIWDANTVELLETLSGQTGFISDLALSPDGERLASSDNSGVVRIWNTAPSTAWRTFPVSFAQGIDWSGDSRYLIVAGGDVVEDTEPPSFAIWDVVADQVAEEGLAADLQYKALYAFFSPDEEEILYAGLEGFPNFTGLSKVYVVDTWTGEILRDFSAEEGNMFRSYNWSPDGTQVAGGMLLSDDIWIFDSQSGDVIQKLSPADSELMINYLEWSPDGSKLASAGMDGTARVWDAQNWELAYTIDGHEPPAEVVNVTWSPDGTMIMTTSGNDERGAKDSTARIWDGDTGKQLMVMSGHTKLVQFGAWSPDSGRVATASNDGTVRVWDVKTGDELLTLDIPTLYGSAVWWSPDGEHIAIGGLGTQTSVWRVWQSTDELIEYAKDCCAFRDLTPEEREQYGLANK